MSALGCTCGNTITDIADSLPYAADFRVREDVSKPPERLAATLTEFLKAREQHREAQFLYDFFIKRPGPATWTELAVTRLTGKPLGEVFAELSFHYWNQYERRLYECDECGRLWVETAEKTRFAPYMPETDTRHVLWSGHHHDPTWPG